MQAYGTNRKTYSSRMHGRAKNIKLASEPESEIQVQVQAVERGSLRLRELMEILAT